MSGRAAAVGAGSRAESLRERAPAAARIGVGALTRRTARSASGLPECGAWESN